MAAVASLPSESKSVPVGRQPGFHGKILLGISAAIATFFLARAVGMIAQRAFNLADPIALGVFLGALGGLAILAFRFMTGKRSYNWAVAIEDAGLFSFKQYKKTLGLRVRRLTILGILLIFGSGVYTLMENGWLDMTQHWYIETPFLGSFMLMPDIRFTVPLLLIGLGLWLAWRFVNMPAFADFLIATEAEINKVSWPTKKQLIRDTIVVLTALALFTIFFFVVDVFWGWLLSRSFIGVLPAGTTTGSMDAVGPMLP